MINSIKVCNSINFSIFHRIVWLSPQSILEYFQHPKRKLHYSKYSPGPHYGFFSNYLLWQNTHNLKFAILTIFKCTVQWYWASLVAQTVKNLPAMQETWVWSLGQEDFLEKGMATHSSIHAWRIPWTEEPGGLQSMRSQSQTQWSD